MISGESAGSTLSVDAERRWTFPWVGTIVGLCAMLCAALIEHAMGRSLFCKCGSIHFWAGQVDGPENSQQIADWYSFAHIIHGFAFYCLFWWIGRRRGWSMDWRVAAAIVVECGWEMLENSPLIINRYRNTTAQGYVGDSILNSMSDVSFAILGFCAARFLPVWATVGLIVLFEAIVGYAIRDNLAMNIIMLIHPFAAIRHWQMGA